MRSLGINEIRVKREKLLNRLKKKKKETFLRYNIDKRKMLMSMNETIFIYLYMKRFFSNIMNLAGDNLKYYIKLNYLFKIITAYLMYRYKRYTTCIIYVVPDWYILGILLAGTYI